MDDDICSCGFTVYVKSQSIFFVLDCDIKEVDGIVAFGFQGEF
jgi:hypothetical protein